MIAQLESSGPKRETSSLNVIFNHKCF